MALSVVGYFYTDHTQWNEHTFSSTPLGERSARRRVDYLHNKNRRDTSIPPGGIQTRNTRKRAAIYPQINPRRHCFQLSNHVPLNKFWKAVRKINLDSLGI
jgi:hypothetical protein